VARSDCVRSETGFGPAPVNLAPPRRRSLPQAHAPSTSPIPWPCRSVTC